MIANISHIDILYQVDNTTITNTAEFELKLSGELWSSFFSKYIANTIINNIKNYNGTIKIFHTVNLIARNEKFTLRFTHSPCPPLAGHFLINSEENTNTRVVFAFPMNEEQEKLNALIQKKKKAEMETIERERQTAERLRLEKIEHERLEAERVEREKEEKEKLAKERMEKRKLEKTSQTKITDLKK